VDISLTDLHTVSGFKKIAPEIALHGKGNIADSQPYYAPQVPSWHQEHGGKSLIDSAVRDLEGIHESVILNVAQVLLQSQLSGWLVGLNAQERKGKVAVTFTPEYRPCKHSAQATF